MDCVFCWGMIKNGDKCRTLSTYNGALHPQIHTYPNGLDINNKPVTNSCKMYHVNTNHIHEKCVPAWCDKFNMPFPEPFEPGDFERLKREVV